MKLKEIFGDKRIVALAGDKNSGKTNNLMALLKDFRQHNKTTLIYVYGLEQSVVNWLIKLGHVFEVSSLEQLAKKKDALFVVDEMHLLKLSDKRYTDLQNKFFNFIYHNNNWIILCSPLLREFNSIVGSKVERWLLKSMDAANVVNGSQLKDVIMKYNGRYKVMDSIDIPKNKLLVINEDYERVIELEYIKEVDTKKDNVDIFEVKK